MADKDRIAAAVNSIRGNFDRGASAYAAFEERNDFFRRLLTGLLTLSPVRLGERVLDVGCGTGASLALLGELAGPEGEAVGLDNSQGMLDEARKRLGAGQRLMLGDGCDFAGLFADKFDLVVYNAVLFLLPDAEASLESAMEVLKPGGRVLFSNLDSISAGGVAVVDILAEAGCQPGRHTLSPWAKVEEAARKVSGDLVSKALDLNLPVPVFRQFYGLEPMSAGLLPRTPYAERVGIIDELGEKWLTAGVVPVQRWMLGMIRKM